MKHLKDVTIKKEYEQNKVILEEMKKEVETLNEYEINLYYKLLQRNNELKKKIAEGFVPIVAVDFDGVLNRYTGWKGENKLFEPQSGVKYFLKKLNEDYDVVIFTCRNTEKVKKWLKDNELDMYIKGVTENKPKAIAYIDDRAINYDGSYEKTLKKLKDFKTWWE